MRGFTTALFVLGLAGCGAPDGPIDADGDGVPARKDCNDADPNVFPGAPEICNRVDDDCDGVRDNDAVDAPAWYLDADQDGHGNPEAPVYACEQPGRRVDNDQDCNDADPNEHPGAWDYPGDGIDRDCDGEDATEARCWAQARVEGDVWITGAAEAEVFCTEHNGLTGTLHIEGSDLVDLSGLDCVCEAAALVIEDNALLEEVDLGRLPQDLVVQRIEVRNNPMLTRLSPGVAGESGSKIEVVDSLVYENNPALVDVPCIYAEQEDGTRVLDGDYRLVDSGGNPPCSLAEVRGDLHLEAPVGEDWADWGGLLEVGGDVDLVDLPASPDVTFPDLERVGGTLQVSGAERLHLPFPSLAAVDGAFRLLSVGEIVVGLGSLTSVADDFEVVGSPSADAMHSGPNFDVGGDIRLIGNEWVGLVHFGDRLGSVGGDLEYSGNLQLCDTLLLNDIPGDLRVVNNRSDFCNFEFEIQTVGGTLEFANNRIGELIGPSITSAAELLITDNADLQRIDLPLLDGPASVWLTDNPDLSDVALPSLATAGQVYIHDNPQLADLEGFSALRQATDVSVIQQPSIDGLAQLETVDTLLLHHIEATSFPLASLRTVSTELDISYAPGLTTLDGLEQLRAPGGIKLYLNDVLSDISALDGVESVGAQGVTIALNPGLSNARVQAWVDSLPGGVVGPVTISGNAP